MNYNAVHTGRNAAKASTDDAGGLEPVVCLAHDARVILTAWMWDSSMVPWDSSMVPWEE